MHSKYKNRSGLIVPLLAIGIAITLMFLAGCVSTSSDPEFVTVPAPSLEVKPNPTPILDDGSQDVVDPPAMPLEVLDFWNYLPAVPPGFGKTANHLIFFSDSTGIYQVHQINLDGSERVPLTHNPEIDIYDMEPDWSPDGRIAFTQKINGKWEIFILHPDSRRPVQITEWGADSWSLAWSPDGQSLAFVSNATFDDEIYVIDPDGGTPVNLTENPDADDYLPDWSPDGEQIAYVSIQDLVQDIFIMASNGSGVMRITTTEARDTAPDWSPDGKKIAFASDPEGNYEIYLMDVPDEAGSSGSEPLRLTRVGGYKWSPAWSPDGQWIAYTALNVDIETYDLYIMAADGSNQTQLTFDPADEIIPRWWP